LSGKVTRMAQHTRRQFIGSVGSAAVTTVLAPGALAAGRAVPARGQTVAASTPRSPSSYYAYQSEIYLNGMVAGVTPKITTNLSKLEAQASQVLDRQARAYFLASAGGRFTARTNARAFRGWQIVPRMFRDHEERYLSTTILGTRMPAPVILAPVGRQKLAHPDGDLASARAAADLELTYVRSTHASSSIEEVAAANGTGSRWYQLDWPSDDDLDVRRLRRARSAGYTHLLLTPPRPGRPWTQLLSIRKSWDGPVLLTGIKSVRDAKDAAKRRFDGIVVSNHRGRRGDGAIGSVDALPPIVDAVGSRLAVLFDSGIRTGPDIFRALALGADAVLVGRPYVYGLGVDGQAGVTHVMRTFLAEFDLTLAGAGYSSHRELSRASLVQG
jgi:isopentenyl diphosphate isomerase/L-lactate dehydrogenase-like FMN-dependent dehydrogenase